MIETIATIFLLTVGIVGLAAGMAATERIATINQDQSKLEVAIRQLSDWVRDSSCDRKCFSTQPRALPYRFCEQLSTNDQYNLDLSAAKSAGLVPASSKFIRVLESPTTAANGPPYTTSGCPTRVGDWGVQEITVEVADASHTLSRVVWKSAAW